MGEILKEVLPEDLLKYGLIPEFVGRLPVLVTLNSLDSEDLVKILTEPKNALVKQYQKLFAMDNVDLEFEESAIKEIASLAQERKTGARGLRAILEEVMLNVMYEIPSRDDVDKCIITEESVKEKVEPDMVYLEPNAKKSMKKQSRPKKPKRETAS